MRKLLFSAEGRIGRGTFWMATLGSVFGILTVAALLDFALASMIPNQAGADEGFSVDGIKAVPFLIVNFGAVALIAWSSICLGVKRYHDRDKPGIWVVLSLVPFANLWYFIETGFLKGTNGPNTFGPNPLGHTLAARTSVSPAL